MLKRLFNSEAMQWFLMGVVVVLFVGTMMMGAGFPM